MLFKKLYNISMKSSVKLSQEIQHTEICNFSLFKKVYQIMKGSLGTFQTPIQGPFQRPYHRNVNMRFIFTRICDEKIPEFKKTQSSQFVFRSNFRKRTFSLSWRELNLKSEKIPLTLSISVFLPLLSIFFIKHCSRRNFSLHYFSEFCFVSFKNI